MHISFFFFFFFEEGEGGGAREVGFGEETSWMLFSEQCSQARTLSKKMGNVKIELKVPKVGWHNPAL